MGSPERFESAWARVAAGESAEQVAGEYPDEAALLLSAAELRTEREAIAPSNAQETWESIRAQVGDADVYKLGSYRPRRRIRRRALAVLLAATLGVLLLSGAALGASPGSPLYPVRRSIERALVTIAPGAGMELRIAQARLHDLLQVLDSGDSELAPSLARDLVKARAEAISDGAITTSIDGEVARQVPAALEGAPTAIQSEVRQILGPLLPPTEPATSSITAEGPSVAESRPDGDTGTKDGSGSSTSPDNRPGGDPKRQEQKRDRDQDKHGGGGGQGGSGDDGGGGNGGGGDGHDGDGGGGDGHDGDGGGGSSGGGGDDGGDGGGDDAGGGGGGGDSSDDGGSSGGSDGAGDGEGDGGDDD